ncbi:hypothetical protein MPLB_2030006 [Mesorhizobium sp. ORS 3324]|nr:hypothetical protein MPLB_2030006 [Mesorhizobium sp. ORS 3324]
MRTDQAAPLIKQSIFSVGMTRWMAAFNPSTERLRADGAHRTLAKSSLLGDAVGSSGRVSRFPP